MKLIALGLVLLFTSFISYPNLPLPKANNMNICPMHEAKSGDICPMHASLQAQASMTAVTVSQEQEQEQEQNPPQPGDTPTHRLSPGDGCSSVNPNAEPGTNLNGVKANTVGCMCIRKCVNGYTQEDLSRDKKGVYICKNACHKDRCFCPDPCKS